jgi:NAD(P)-dependent dehydrogenase (short-subunit alcohol dehydrogenase family)
VPKALVTGAARRIGRVIAIKLAKAGYDVVIHYSSSKEDATDTANEVRECGREAWLVQEDLRNPKFADKLIEKAVRESGGPIDVLVNNASTFPINSPSETGWADLSEMMRLHAYAPLTLARSLVAQGGSSIVNIVDTRALSLDLAHFPYWLSKRTLADITQALAVELAPARVNAVSPGPILPPEDAPDRLQAGIDATVLGRAGTPNEVADAVLFLLRAEYTTGENIAVDGGRHLRG